LLAAFPALRLSSVARQLSAPLLILRRCELLERISSLRRTSMHEARVTTFYWAVKCRILIKIGRCFGSLVKLNERITGSRKSDQSDLSPLHLRKSTAFYAV
jgi:hypothetical protein